MKNVILRKLNIISLFLYKNEVNNIYYCED